MKLAEVENQQGILQEENCFGHTRKLQDLRDEMEQVAKDNKDAILELQSLITHLLGNKGRIYCQRAARVWNVQGTVV